MHNVQKNEHSIDGKVVYISQPKYISEKLSTKTLVIEVFDGDWRKECPITYKNGRMDCLKDVKEGDWVNAQFLMSGNKGKGEGEPRWFCELIGITCIRG